MHRSNTVDLPLHGGSPPIWLLSRMRAVGQGIMNIMVDSFGPEKTVKRLVDPFWFQALSCVLAFDWHSSGTTTVLTGILRSILDNNDLGIIMAGGKGKYATAVSSHLDEQSSRIGLSDDQKKQLLHASKLAAKVDTVAVQTNYSLYHHALFVTPSGYWGIVQQGMNTEEKYARRYHWLCDNIDDLFINTVASKRHFGTPSPGLNLDLTHSQSDKSKKISLDIVQENSLKLESMYAQLQAQLKGQQSLTMFLPEHNRCTVNQFIKKNHIDLITFLPKRIDWSIFDEKYGAYPENYDELLKRKGAGPATVRALALVAELIYGEENKWKDPVKYSYSFGGKDGVPYPVNRKSMDNVAAILQEGLDQSKVSDEKKKLFQKRLIRFKDAATKMYCS